MAKNPENTQALIAGAAMDRIRKVLSLEVDAEIRGLLEQGIASLERAVELIDARERAAMQAAYGNRD